MIPALYILLSLVVVGVILKLTHKDDDRVGEDEQAADPQDEQCCGRHAVCERFADVADAPVYFDDEELDAFAGREASAYMPEEIEEFRDVLFTLLPQDLVGWAHSLEMRNVVMPEDIRDEYMLLLSEAQTLSLNNARTA